MLYSDAPQPQQKPVVCDECDGTGWVAASQHHIECPKCTAPQQREWVGIAPNEVVSELERVGYEGSEALIFALGAAWAEQRVREKNGGAA
jgi:hypothetical protein